MSAQLLRFPGVQRDRDEDFRRRREQTPPPRLEHSGKKLEVVWPQPEKKQSEPIRDWLILPESVEEWR